MILVLSWFNWWVSFAPEFQCCYFCESSCLFYLSFKSDFFVSKIYVVVVVALLFYVHGKHLMSCRDRQLT